MIESAIDRNATHFYNIYAVSCLCPSGGTAQHYPNPKNVAMGNNIATLTKIYC